MKRTQIKRGPSQRLRNFQKELDAVTPQILERGCEFGRYADRKAEPPEIPNVWLCAGHLVVHHAKGRRVRGANEPANLRCLCDRHHVFAHNHSEWAREVGLMLSRI